MKQIRLLSTLLGVLFVVCQTHAADLKSSLDLFKPEVFGALSVDEKVIVVKTLRHALVEISEQGDGDLEFAILEKSLPPTSLWAVALPAAFASPADSNMCITNGTPVMKVNGVCPDLPQGSCMGTTRPCEVTLYGPGQCATPVKGAPLRGCEDLMSQPGADKRVEKYYKDSKNTDAFFNNMRVAAQRCSQVTSETCTTLQNRMHTAFVTINNGRSADGKPELTGPVGPFPRKAEKAPFSPDDNGVLPQTAPPIAGGIPPMPVVPPVSGSATGPAPVPPAVAAAPSSPNDKLTPENQAYRDTVAGEIGKFGNCNEWQLAEELEPDAHGTDHPLLMSFPQAQQLVCEHKPFSTDEMNDIGSRLATAISKVAYKKGAGFECKTKSRSSDMGIQCGWLLGSKAHPGLLQNYANCKAEMAKHPVDEKWSKAVHAIPGVVIKQAQYTTAEAYNNPNGMAPIELEFKASYKNVSLVSDDHFHAQKYHSVIINGKYVSRTLSAYNVPICDVRRDEAGRSTPSAPRARPRSGPGSATVTESDKVETSEGSSGSSRAPASAPDESTWVVPSLPQGAPGSGGHGAGQGH